MLTRAIQLGATALIANIIEWAVEVVVSEMGRLRGEVVR